MYLSRAIAALLLAGTMAMPGHLCAGSLGTFGGKVVRSAAARSAEDPPGRWIYLQGKGGSVRRVEISAARYEYAVSIPAQARASTPADDLRQGAAIQVTAEQDENSGDWKARSILFLRLARARTVRSAAR